MTPEARAAEAPLVDPDELADAVVELIRDESLAGRVMLLPRGEPRRLLDALAQSCCRRALCRHGAGADHGGMPELPRSRPETEQSGAVRALAGEQEGIVTGGQLLAAGVERVGDRSRSPRRQAALLHRGVYSTVAPELLTEDGPLLAALLAAGDGALLSHGTAAWRWRIIPAPPSMIELALPRDARGDRGA